MSFGRGLARVCDDSFIVESGSGCYIHTQDNRTILDFTSGIAVLNLGHCHPRVTAAVTKQVATINHAQANLMCSRPALDLVAALKPLMPHPSLDSFLFFNTGAEAVENALKLAHSATNRQNVIVMQGGFHGRTFGAMALTRSKIGYSQGFGPLIPGVFATPFPYWHQLGLEPDTPSDVLVKSAIFQLDLLLKQQCAPSDTCAIIVEPILGEGGYVPAPPAYLKALREICDSHGILLVFDEVQSGFARTGKLFACEYSGVVPDIMTMAKGIANGFPLSAIVSRKEITDKQTPGSMGGTYSGNVVSCASALAVIETLTSDNILYNVNERSKQLFESLHNIQSIVGKHIIRDIRGHGLMVAIEFTSFEIASTVQKKCLHDKNLFVLTTSIFPTLRLIPPLIISQSEMAQACQILTDVITQVSKP